MIERIVRLLVIGNQNLTKNVFELRILKISEVKEQQCPRRYLPIEGYSLIAESSYYN